MSDMLDVFGAAAEQMRQEEKDYGADTKKHDLILAKLDRVIEQNKTIAEGMVSVVEMVKEKLVMPAKEEQMFKAPEPKPFRPMEWQPKQEFKPRQMPQPSMAQLSQQAQPSFNPASFTPPLNPPSFAQTPTPPLNPPNLPPPDFGMPSLQPAPEPDLDFPEEPLLEEEPKKKGLFGMFKK
jgi:hypothetical protein